MKPNKMPTTSIRYKIIATALLFMVVTNLIFAVITIGSVRLSTEAIEQEGRETLLEYASEGVTDLFQDVDTTLTRLQAPTVIDYARNYWGLRPSDDAEAARQAVNRYVNDLALSAEQIEQIYVLGKNDNQLNFSKSIGVAGWNEELLPSSDEIIRLGLFHMLIRKNGLPMYFNEQKELIETVDKRTLAKPDVIARVTGFFQKLNDRVIVTSWADNVLIVVVLHPDFAARLLPDQIQDHQYLSLQDDQGQTVWTNATGMSESKSMMTLERVIEPYPFRIAYHYDSNNASHLANLLQPLKNNAIFMFSSLAVSFVLAALLSRQIVMPLRLVSGQMRERTRQLPLRGISLPLQGPFPAMFRSMSMRRKLIVLFVISVVTPSLALGINSAISVYSHVKAKWMETEAVTTKQMSMSIGYRAQSYVSLGHYILAGKSSSMPRGMSNLSYYVLFSQDGKTSESSIYQGRSSLFQIPPQVLLKQWEANEPLWLTNQQDIFGQHSLALFLRDHDRTLELRLRDSAWLFQSHDAYTSFLIVDDQGDIIFRSSSDKALASLAQSISPDTQLSERELGGLQVMVTHEGVPNTNWSLYTVRPLYEVFRTSQNLLVWNIAIVVLVLLLAVLASIMLSHLLVKPLEALKSKMNSFQGEAAAASAVPYGGNDEIGHLVRTFNLMTERMNDLFEDNLRGKLREQELSALKSQAELSMLQQQINPHFLYNTLEIIHMRSRQQGSEDIGRMVTALSDIFRFTISSEEETTVELSRELEHIRNFLIIHEARFRDRLQIEWDIQPETELIPVLKFFLQPVVENALKHGLEDLPSGAVLEIRTKLEEGRLIITVRDNGIGMEQESLTALIDSIEREKRTSEDGGYGLVNVYRRMRLYYGDRMQLRIESGMFEGTTVQFILPQRQESK